MYVRKTQRKNSDGSTAEYLSLAVNEWDSVNKRSKAKVIHSFGRFTPETREEMIRLANSIARICNFTVIENEGNTSCSSSSAKMNDPVVEGITQHLSKQYGAVYVLQAIWNRLGLGDEIRRIRIENNCTVEYEKALLAMTLNRLCEPESKLGGWDRWVKDSVYLPESSGINLHQYYEAMDLFYRNAEKIEEAVFFKTANLFNLDVDLVFYDTTTISFSVDEEDELRKYGHSKEGGWSPQIVVALAVTKEGFPVRSWVFQGNQADVSTIEKIRKDLRGWNLERCLFVGDAGMNSEDNRQELVRGCGKYLLACRASSVKEIREEVIIRPGRFRSVSDNLKVKEVEVGDGEKRRRYFLCHNPQESDREKAHRDQLISELEEEVMSHSSKKATSKWAIRLLASGRYGRYLKVDTEGTIAIDYEKVKNLEKYDGKWVLISNDDTISAEDAGKAYKSMWIIEGCFRSMKKSQIKMDPMYHLLPKRIEAHVKICVLALLLQRIVEYESGENWFHLRHVLSQLQVTEYTSQTHRFFRRNEVREAIKAVLKKLKIEIPKQLISIDSKSGNLPI